MEKKDKAQYNLTLAPAYKNKRGYWSLNIDAKSFDALQQIEVGGRLVLKILDQDKPEDQSTRPDAFFEYMRPAQVKKYKEEAAKRAESYPPKNRPATTAPKTKTYDDQDF